jgi:DNA polymerase-1
VSNPHEKGDAFDPAQIRWVLDARAFARFLTAIEGAVEVYFDTETSGRISNLDPHDPRARVVMLTATMEGPDFETWCLPLFHPESPFQGIWREALSKVAAALAKRPLDAHHGKYDAKWVMAHTKPAINLAHKLEWDTHMSAHGMDELTSRRLKKVASHVFEIEEWDEFDLAPPEAALRVDLITLGIYACQDTYWGARLAAVHRDLMYRRYPWAGEWVYPEEPPFSQDEVESAKLGRLMETVSMPTVRSLTQMEYRGMEFDLDWANERTKLEKQERDGAFERLPMYGMDPTNHSFASNSHWFKEWSQRAVDAGDLLVLERTGKGAASWRKGNMARLVAKGLPVAEDLMVYNRSVKRLQFLNSWMNHQRDGIIYATYNAGSLVTGRLSSSEPNLQQVTHVLRPAFRPRKGFVLADIDQSQVELRVAADIAQCEPMIEAFNQGRDLHKALAMVIQGVAESAVSAPMRQKAKSANFGLLYRMGASGFQSYAEENYGVSMSMAEAQRVHAAFFDTWYGMREWHNRAVAEAHHTGQVVSPIGRVRRIPQIFWGDEKAVSSAERVAINAPVQGFASDIMQIGIALVLGEIPGYEHWKVPGVYPVATVHDSVDLEIPENDWERLTRLCIDRITRGTIVVLRERFNYHFTVPLVAEANVGTRWGMSDVGEISGSSLDSPLN